MALKNLLLLAASFTAGFAVPLEGAQEEHLEQRQQACSSVWYDERGSQRVNMKHVR